MSYQPHGDEDRRAMLDRLGIATVDDLFADIPESLRNPTLDVPEGLAEPDLMRHMAELSGRNQAQNLVCFLGAGAYDHYVPAAVDELAGRAEFVTGYTPYQPEMTQGVLQAIYEYQSVICELTGLDVSNASMYDGATALWEALLMSEREARRGRFLLSSGVNPRWVDTARSYAAIAGFAVDTLADSADGHLDLAALEAALAEGASGVAVALPTAFGIVQDYSAAAELCHAHRALLIVVANPTALALYRTPGEMGADICVGDGQPLGVPLQFGGPYFGFMAARDKLVRKMPGRIVGATVDLEGKRGFVLTLQAREQHIRRDKATSNICSNQALMALRATVYATLLGRAGLVELAENCARAAAYLRARLAELPGVSLLHNGPWFHEFAIRLPAGQAARWHQAALEAGFLAGLPLGEWSPELQDCLLLCVTEKRTRAEMDALVALFGTLGV